MQLTSNSRPFIESQQYSQFILMTLNDGLLPGEFYRNVQDFMNGETLNIKTIGDVTLQEAEEDVPLIFNPIESGEITFRITDYVGDAWFITDDLREEGSQIDSLMAARGVKSTRAIQERFETGFLEACATPYQTSSDPYAVNGFAHLICSAETNNIFSIDHLIDLRLAFNKANVPDAGRIVIVDPVVEATLNKQVSIANDVTQFAADIMSRGLAAGQKFITNWFGWDIMTSNRLFVGAFNDGTTSIANGVANIAMCIADDQTKPMMGAWRRLPTSEGSRDADHRRDKQQVTARWGFGVQRMDSMACIVTSPTATS